MKVNRLADRDEGATLARTKVLVTDLDNTLWDWFAAWHGSFAPFLDALIRQSGVPRALLEKEIQAVHQLRGTVEYSNLIDEVPSLRAALRPRIGDRDPVWPHYSEALATQRELRRSRTRLYPRVAETLTKLRGAGIRVIAYTESVSYWTEWRIRQTGLDGIIDVLYSSVDHDLPLGMSVSDLRNKPTTEYGLQHTEHRHVQRGVLKPNPGVLLDILEQAGFHPEEAAYVGDSLLKDIGMAQEAGVVDIHAKYGEAHSQPAYELLRRVTHWPKEHVETERSLGSDPARMQPSHTLPVGFHQILPLFGFCDGIVE